MPELADTLQILVNRGTRQDVNLNHHLDEIKRQVEESDAAQARRTAAALKSILASITVRFNATLLVEEEEEDLAQPQRMLGAVEATSGSTTSGSTTSGSTTSTSTTSGLTASASTASASTAFASTAFASAASGLITPPAYEMSRRSRTVADVYTEWMVGFPPGPSIKELDRLYGPRWRAGRHKESQFYSLRRDLITEIQRIAKRDNISEEVAIEDLQRRQTAHAWSINRLCKEIRQDASAGGGDDGVRRRKRKRADAAAITLD